jgi:hypothetical protein
MIYKNSGRRELSPPSGYRPASTASSGLSGPYFAMYVQESLGSAGARPAILRESGVRQVQGRQM